VAPVLNRIHSIRPDCCFLIRCALPKDEIQARLNMDFVLVQEPVDVGVIQHSAIDEDREASIISIRDWTAQMPTQIDRDIDRLGEFQPDLILSDISPLAFPVAKALGVPGIGLATLDWHTIYAHWLPADDPAIKTLAQAYHLCDILLKPPMSMDMKAFSVQKNIPLIATQPLEIADPVPDDPRKKALVLFGGCGNPPFDLQALADMDDWLFLIPDVGSDAPANVKSIHYSADMRPVDLMRWVDVVVGKPGYGLLSECWVTTTPIAWVERPDFPEFPMLKQWLDDSMPAAGMSRSDFRQGHWQDALAQADQHRRSYPAWHDGAVEAADTIIAYTLA